MVILIVKTISYANSYDKLNPTIMPNIIPDKFIQTQTLYAMLELEPFFILGALLFLTWFFYRFFLREVSEERHRKIKSHFKLLAKQFIIFTLFFFIFYGLHQSQSEIGVLIRLTPYAGLIAFIWGSIIFVKTCRLLVLQYLFMGSMQAGVPLLLVNIFSLALSLLILFWSVARIFGLQLGPMLATSAAFSIILGLALQDTLGNVFAGVSLQLDKSFEIGNWLEVINGSQKIVGQVKEITWRSTVLGGFSDELITLPNRFMAQAQISNYSPPENPIVRSQIFRVDYQTNPQQVIELLEKMIATVPEVRKQPSPFAFINEINENWISIKIIYFIDSYGAQFVIGDKILRKGLEALSQVGVKLASNRLDVHIGAPLEGRPQSPLSGADPT